MEQPKPLSLRVGAVIMLRDLEPDNPAGQIEMLATIAGQYSAAAVRAMADALANAAIAIEEQEKRRAEPPKIVRPS